MNPVVLAGIGADSYAHPATSRQFAGGNTSPGLKTQFILYNPTAVAADFLNMVLLADSAAGAGVSTDFTFSAKLLDTDIDRFVHFHGDVGGDTSKTGITSQLRRHADTIAGHFAAKLPPRLTASDAEVASSEHPYR